MAHGPGIERTYKRLSKLMFAWIESTPCQEKEFDEVTTLWHQVEGCMDTIVETIQNGEAFHHPYPVNEEEP